MPDPKFMKPWHGVPREQINWNPTVVEDACIVFGASEIGFIAASISTWYYRTGLGAVLSWTIGVALVTGLGLALVLKGKVE